MTYPKSHSLEVTEPASTSACKLELKLQEGASLGKQGLAQPPRKTHTCSK